MTMDCRQTVSLFDKSTNKIQGLSRSVISNFISNDSRKRDTEMRMLLLGLQNSRPIPVTKWHETKLIDLVSSSEMCVAVQRFSPGGCDISFQYVADPPMLCSPLIYPSRANYLREKCKCITCLLNLRNNKKKDPKSVSTQGEKS